MCDFLGTKLEKKSLCRNSKDKIDRFSDKIDRFSDKFDNVSDKIDRFSGQITAENELHKLIFVFSKTYNCHIINHVI